MQNYLAVLVELQNIDTQLMEIEERRGDLPLRVEQLEEEIHSTEGQIEKKKEELKEIGFKIRHLEGNIKMDENKLARYQNQLYSVKTNREYDALTAEIEHKKIEIEEQETKVIELVDREKETSDYIKEHEERMKGLKKELKRNRKELNEMMKKTEVLENDLRNKREKLVTEIKPSLISTYERIKKARGGSAVVPITRDACGGCFKKIPPQKIVEIRKMDRIIPCEVCGRILIWKEE